MYTHCTHVLAQRACVHVRLRLDVHTCILPCVRAYKLNVYACICVSMLEVPSRKVLCTVKEKSATGLPVSLLTPPYLWQAQHVIPSPSWRHGLLAQAPYVPYSHSLVQGGRNHQVLLGVERGTHHVVVVAGEHRDAGAGLPVPDADGLVVGRAHDPGVFVVELDGADVVQVAQQCEQAAPQLVIPDLDFVVIAPGYEQRLGAVKVHPTHWAIVLIKPVDERAHAVVPQLQEQRTDRLGVVCEADRKSALEKQLGEKDLCKHQAAHACASGESVRLCVSVRA